MGHLRANKKGGTLAPMKKHYVNLNHYDVFSKYIINVFVWLLFF